MWLLIHADIKVNPCDAIWLLRSRSTLFQVMVSCLAAPSHYLNQCWLGLWAMMTSSNGNIFRVTGPLCGEFSGLRWIPRTKASDAELFFAFFDLHLIKRLRKHSWDWWFETLSRSLWRHCNGGSTTKFKPVHAYDDLWVCDVICMYIERYCLYVFFVLFAGMSTCDMYDLWVCDVICMHVEWYCLHVFLYCLQVWSTCDMYDLWVSDVIWRYIEWYCLHVFLYCLQVWSPCAMCICWKLFLRVLYCFQVWSTRDMYVHWMLLFTYILFFFAGMIIIFLATLPLVAFHINAQRLLTLLGQDPLISQ